MGGAHGGARKPGAPGLLFVVSGQPGAEPHRPGFLTPVRDYS